MCARKAALALLIQMETKATAPQLHLRERRQVQNGVRIAESLWKGIFAVPAGERGTETPARIVSAPMTSPLLDLPAACSRHPY